METQWDSKNTDLQKRKDWGSWWMGHRSNLENASNKEEKRVMIRANFAGSGKNFIGKHFNDLSYNTFFVVPQNMQKQDVPCDAVTQNRLFSVPVCKGESRLPKYDYNDDDVIFFDEIYMSSPYILKKIRVFCNENPHLIVIGAGDVKQFPSIEA